MKSALLAAVLLAAGCVSSFCQVKGNDKTERCQLEAATNACALNSSLKLPAQAAETIFSILMTGGNSWSADLEGLGQTLGSDGLSFVTCEVAAIVSVYGRASVSDQPGSTGTPSALLVVRARSWLAAHSPKG